LQIQYISLLFDLKLGFSTKGSCVLSHSALMSHRRIALLTDGYSTPFLAKTAISMLRYRTSDIAAVIDRESSGKSSQELFSAGGNTPVVGQLFDSNFNSSDVDALYIGIAPPGGKLPEQWRPVIQECIRRKIDVVSGLHDFLVDDQDYLKLAKLSGARLIDVRRNQYKQTAHRHLFRRGNTRIHAVGNDCSIGKMVASLEVQMGLTSMGHDAKFLATGQTGIMISGEGVPIDCVVADFVNGAAEELVAENEQRDFLLIEGQGSISHPAYSAVTLGLLHGCAPDGLIFCYEAGRKQVKGFDNIDIPPMKDQMRACEVMANLRHPCKIIGIAINSRTMSEVDALKEIANAEATYGLPACDVYRTGADKLVSACVALREELTSK
jgi:uncharacterized NAD-dependent epimerase/dehydratase family protein